MSSFRYFTLACIVLILSGVAVSQQLTVPPPNQSPPLAPMNAPPTNTQAVASTGLLPIYGVELGVDKSWIDGANFPSQSADFPNAGVNRFFQQVWDALKPAGFNFVRVGFDVYDLSASANRAANLCNWAQHNNLKVLLVLRGTSGSGDYASGSAAFVKTLAGLLKQDAYKAAYAQVAAYELEPDLNNPSVLKQVSNQAKAQDLLMQTAQSVRTSETQALQGSGIDATPIVVSASFDYELISTKAIAATTLANDPYNTAYSSLVQWLKPLAASPNIDMIAINWFPGTISAGTVDKPPTLLRSLAQDLPGKPFLFTTGFSTAFHSEDEQKQYYTMTFANLGDLRASGGQSSPFLGVIYRAALNGKPPVAPDPSLPQAISKWDWPSKADELAAMWSDQKKSDEMSWWVESVCSNLGLLQAQADAFDAASLKPKAGMLALGQIASAVVASSSPAPSQMPGPAAGGATPDTAMPGGTAAGAMPGTAMPGGTAAGAMPDTAMPGGTAAGAMPGTAMPGAVVPGQGSSMGMMPAQNSGGVASTLGQVLQAKATQGLSGLLDSVMQKLGSMEQSGLNGGASGFSGMPGAMNGFGSRGPGSAKGAGFNATASPCPAMPTAPAPPDPSSVDPSAMGMPADPSAMAAPTAPCAPNLANNSLATPPVAPMTLPAAMPVPGGSGAAVSATPDPSSPTPGASGATTPTVATQPAGTGTPAAAVPAASPTVGAASATSATPVASVPMGLAAGSITLTKADIALQPANPTVGQTVQITANLHNQNSSSAAGITILASGAKNAVLAEADGIQVPANSTYSANLQWTPNQANLTPITLRVSDGTGTEMANVTLDPVTVAPSAKVRAPFGSSTTSASAGKSDTGDSSGSTTLAPLGFAKIGDLIAQNLVVGVPGSILVPISDPLQVPLTNIRAVLTVDGKMVQTQGISMLLPHQSRSIVFSNVVISQPGAHQARVGVQLLRAGKSQLGTVTESVFVQPAPTLSAASANKTSGTAPLKTAQSTSSHLRSLTPPPATGTTTTVASAAPTAGSTAPGMSAAALSNQHSQLTLRTSDLSYSPAPANPGQPVTFRVVVRNPSAVPAQQSALVLSLYADGKLVAVSQPPIQFSVGANSSYQASWQAAMPVGRQVQLVASVTGGGGPPASGTASIVLQSAAPTIPKAPNPTKPGAAKH